ncbi:MAG: hypothetical protein CL692_02930 [Cellvibrionales bacterium]|nr:hypothetical protein [Cellvibrionales bacterium]
MSRSKDYLTIEATSSDQLFTDSNGGLRSSRFDDIYYHPGQGAEESQHVFLAGNDLPYRWLANGQETPSKDHFVIAETGFGSGLNFLACWQLWRDSHHHIAADQAPRTLYFYSSELYPLSSAALIKSIRHYNPFPNLATELLNRYPDAIGGDYLIELDTDTSFPVVLVLLFGDSSEAFKRLEYYPKGNPNDQNHSTIASNFNAKSGTNHRGLTVDAWFLDGYAPTKSPDLWQNSIYALMAKHSAANTTVATFTVARTVRDGLSKHGFAVKKIPGFGRKREMLTGTFEANTVTTLTAIPQRKKVRSDLSNCYYPGTKPSHNFGDKKRRATIVGAGIAGCCTAYQLAKRGWQVNLLDSHDEVASAASGNPRAVLYARTAQHRSAMADFHEAALHYAQQFYPQLGDCQLAQGLKGMLKLGESLPDELLNAHPELRSRRNVNVDQASELSGVATRQGGIYYPQAGWLAPKVICQALSGTAGIKFIANTQINRLEKKSTAWRAHDQQGNAFDSDIIVITSGHLSHQFEQTAWLPLRFMRGQTTDLAATTESQKLRLAICKEGYSTPADNGYHSIGSSYSKDNELALSPQDHLDNIQKLRASLANNSDWYRQLEASQESLASLNGRVGFRCVTPDYLPIVGPVAEKNDFLKRFNSLKKDAKKTPEQRAVSHCGLFVNTGFGSHGYTTAPLAARLLVAQIEATPIPLGDKITQAIAPNRFLVRQLIRG